MVDLTSRLYVVFVSSRAFQVKNMVTLDTMDRKRGGSMKRRWSLSKEKLQGKPKMLSENY